jgi:hypothetical protein
VKHTYLYRLPAGKRWLWTAGRAGAADLFLSPETGDGTDSDWQGYIGLSNHLGHMQELLHKAVEDEPRVCIGEHYMIPGSFCEVSQSREAEASETVRLVTLWTWDAPVLEGTTLSRLRATLNRPTDAEGMSSRAERMAFLAANEGHRIVPVWM